jgi:hypothetical protein
VTPPEADRKRERRHRHLRLVLPADERREQAADDGPVPLRRPEPPPYGDAA